MYLQVPSRGGLGQYGLGQSAGRFEGVFLGTVIGDTHTKAGIKVTLTHRDTTIAGTIALGPGLRILLGAPCGLEPINLETIPVNATWDPGNPNHFEADHRGRREDGEFPGIHDEGRNHLRGRPSGRPENPRRTSDDRSAWPSGGEMRFANSRDDSETLVINRTDKAMYIRTSNLPATVTIPTGPPRLARGCGCGCSGRAPGGLGLVTQPDHRQLVRDTRIAPYRWVCALDLFFPWKGGEQRNRGTGFLISPRHILTAGHNISPAAGVQALRITVTPAMDGASVLGKPKSPVGSVTLKRSDWWVPPQFTSPAQLQWDFGLLVLPTELPAFRGMTYGYWGDARYEPATVFTPVQAAVGLGPIVHVAGYPADKCGDNTCAPCAGKGAPAYDPVRTKANWASMQWASAGAILPDPPPGQILYSADTCTGMSGGPVWELRKRPDGKYSMVLVAVHTGTYTRLNRITKVDEKLNRGVFLGDQTVREMLRARVIRDQVRPLF